MSPFQLMPDSEEEYKRLREQVLHDGMIYKPVVKDEGGALIDGHRRERIAAELGIACPARVVRGLSDTEKRLLVYALNLQDGRHLTRAQRRELIRRELLHNPRTADRAIGRALGVSHRTVAAERVRLEASGRIAHMEQRDGERSGKPYRLTTCYARNRREEAKVYSALAALGNEAPQGDQSVDKLQVARSSKEWRDRQNQPAPEGFDPGKDMRLYCCDFKTLPLVAGLKPKSIHLIWSDPPYHKHLVHQYEELAELAKTYLVDGGILGVYLATDYLFEIGKRLAKHLDYVWCLSMLHGASNLVKRKACMMGSYARKEMKVVGWRPILLFSKGRRTVRTFFQDRLVPKGLKIGDAQDVNEAIRDWFCTREKQKDWHPWQQREEEAVYYIRMLTKPGDLVVDFFGGSFTTAVGCLRQLQPRRFVGCDIEQGCVNLGLNRLAEKMQVTKP